MQLFGNSMLLRLAIELRVLLVVKNAVSFRISAVPCAVSCQDSPFKGSNSILD